MSLAVITARRWILSLTGLCVLVGVSLAALGEPHAHMLRAPWSESFFAVLPHTAPAAVKVWLFWALAAGLVALLMLRLEPSLGVLDAALGGTLGVWVLAYVGGHALGPIGLFRSWTIWGALGLGALGLWRLGVPGVSGGPLAGQWLALLAGAIALPGLLLLQLGSPVPPHFDTLAAPAAAQRILTFGYYLPWDSDPYGYWDPASQCPGTELLYALLAVGARTSFAVLAQTAAIVPMALLLIAATYRLGRTIGGDIVGGMAALLLFATVFFRVLPYGHGRYVTFVLVAAGLAFFLDTRRLPARLAIGAILLGTAIAAHAIIGAFGMATAAGAVLFWLLNGEVAAAAAGVGLLAGASLLALPTVLVALRYVVPYPALPAIQLAGLVLAVASARRMPAAAASVDVPKQLVWLRVEGCETRVARLLCAALTLAVAAALIWPATTLPSLHDYWQRGRYPTLVSGGALGLAGVLVLGVSALLPPMAVALGIGIGAEYLSARSWTWFSDPRIAVAVEDFFHKADFWYPFALVLPVACLAALLWCKVSRPATLALVLALLFYPWTPYADPNYFQHSVVEGWAYALELAKGGYWGGTGDRRWVQSQAEMALHDLLRGEIAAGRITVETHVPHLTPALYLYKDAVLFSVYTGINDDPYMAPYQPDRSIAGGRIRPAEQFAAAVAARAPYLVIHDVTVDGRRLADAMPALPALDDYEELLNRDGVRLLRLRQ